MESLGEVYLLFFVHKWARHGIDSPPAAGGSLRVTCPNLKISVFSQMEAKRVTGRTDDCETAETRQEPLLNSSHPNSGSQDNFWEPHYAPRLPSV